MLITKNPARAYTFHMLANAHLDPVWLWDWREGLNEAITTCRTILDLMDEDRQLTFIRGEAALYAHIERYDPDTFERIRAQVRAGRWDIVGGTWIQPDTNLPATETLCRQFIHGIRYFKEKFGKSVTTAWAADSFGHSAGLPEILAGAGIQNFAFTRPTDDVLPIREPAFWWRGPAGSEVLGYRPMIGWYGSDRDEMTGRLDNYLNAARKHHLQNVGCFYGLGNHGGGPTRRMLKDLGDWANAHPEVRVVHSGLHRFFRALREELERKGHSHIPTHSGELNFLFRGCYSSAAKFKFPYRATESLLSNAERITTVTLPFDAHRASEHVGAWQTLLFNAFHDILPGTSIERAIDEQITQLGAVQHHAHSFRLSALNSLASRVDTTVPRPKNDHPSAVPFLVFNPLPWKFRGHIELEASLDYRPLMKYSNNGKVNRVPVRVRLGERKDVPFQIIETEHSAMKDLAWRKRVLAEVTLPPLGWLVITVAYEEGFRPRPHSGRRVVARGSNEINNGKYRIAARRGAAGIHILRNGKALPGGDGLSVVTLEDPWGSWGPMEKDPKNVQLTKVRHRWRIAHVEILERGPHRATLFVRMTGGKSRLDLTFSLCKGRDAIDVSARLLVEDRSCRIKMVFPEVGDKAIFEVPGGLVERTPCGEVPGGRWVQSTGKRGSIAFASDALYNFDLTAGNLGGTICRAARYANDSRQRPEHEVWRPALDCGELKFRFILTGDIKKIEQFSQELEFAPVVQLVTPKPGPLPRSASMASLLPTSLRLLALKPAEDGGGLILRAQEMKGRVTRPRFVWNNRRVNLGRVSKYELATWYIFRESSRWRAERVFITEARARSR